MKRPAEINRRVRQLEHPSYEQEPVQSGLVPPIKIRLAAVPELTIFQIREDELEALEHGSPDSHFLTCAISSLTTATAFLIASLTAPPAHRMFAFIFTVVAASLYGAGIPLFVLWLKRRKSTAELASKIRSRLPATRSEKPTSR
jgi:hypothetical protein